MYTHARTQAHRHVCTPYNFKFFSINPFSHLAPGLHTQLSFLLLRSEPPPKDCMGQGARTEVGAAGQGRQKEAVGQLLLVNPDSASCCLS